MLSSSQSPSLSGMPIPSDRHPLSWGGDPFFRLRDHTPYLGNKVDPELVIERFEIIRENHIRAWRIACNRIALLEVVCIAWMAYMGAPSFMTHATSVALAIALVGLTVATPKILDGMKLFVTEFMYAATAEAKAVELLPEEYDMVVGLVSRRQELLPFVTSWLEKAGRLTDIEMDLLIEADELIEARASRAVHPRRKAGASLKNLVQPGAN